MHHWLAWHGKSSKRGAFEVSEKDYVRKKLADDNNGAGAKERESAQKMHTAKSISHLFRDYV